jgi:hypothetical protein
MKPPDATPPVADGKPPVSGAPAAEPAKAPDKYSFTLPHGTSLEAAVLDRYGADMKAAGVSPETAQKLLEADLKRSGEYAARQAEAARTALAERDTRWTGELKAQWGDKFLENSEIAKRGFDFLDADGSFRKELAENVLSHHPKLVGIALLVGKLLKNDTLHVPPGPMTKPAPTGTTRDRLAAEWNKDLAESKG